MFWVITNGCWKSGGWILAVALLLMACGHTTRTEGNAPPETVSDWFAIAVGGKTVHLQIAIQTAEMEHGLMERRELAPDQGMLFVYREPTAMSFWMRNTPLALDIGFFSPEGELREVYAMQPYDETPIRSRDGRLQFALEMNQGWFHDHGIKPGAMLDLATLRASIKARGAVPEEFGLR